jgi:tripartite-type tricarboxylate transporter receptor subunit TctC
VIVVNYPSGFIPGETVAKAPPDGYTLLSIASNLWLGPLMQKTPYDPVRDFSPLTMAASSPLILAVHPALPVKTVKEFIALAKSRPGELNYATGATGSGGHLSAELFKAMAGVDMVRIPYTSGSARMAALMSGEVQLEFVATGAVAPHVKSGRLRPLAVTGAERSVLAPGLPTIAASGVPGYESASTYAIFAPAKTPASLISRLNQEIVRVLYAGDAKDRLFNSGMEAVGSSPEKLAATIKSEMSRMGKVIKDAGIKTE